MNVVGIILSIALVVALFIFAIVQIVKLVRDIKERKQVKQFTKCEEINGRKEDIN